MSAPTKGIFVSNPTRGKKSSKNEDVFDSLSKMPFYRNYLSVWNSLKLKLEKLKTEISTKLVDDIVSFIDQHKRIDESIPAVALYTGTNLSDHDSLFRFLSTEIEKKLTCRLVLLHPSQEISVKYLLGCMICSFITGKDTNSALEELQLSDEASTTKRPTKKVAYTMSHLSEWYEESIVRKSKNVKRPKLVLVIPDIESFSAPILRQFFKTVSVFKNRLPLVLVFGVATSFQEITDKFSYEVLSNYSLHLFQCQSPLVFLNNVLEKVFLNSNCPFQLGNKVFEFLTTMFLYYNFSVEMFIRGIKFCLMDHFFEADINALCCNVEKIPATVKSLTKAQLKEVSELSSVLKYKRKNSIEEKKILNHQEVQKLLTDLHEHLSAFHIAVRCLHIISNNLPQLPLGIHIREIYTMSVSTDVTKSEGFKNCFSMLQHLSKDELLEKISSLISLLSSNKSVGLLANVSQKLQEFRDNIDKSDLYKTVEVPTQVEVPTRSPQKTPPTESRVNAATPRSRAEFMKQLKIPSQPKELTEFETAKRDFLAFLSDEFFKNYLKPASDLPLSEVLIYNQVDVLRSSFDGTPRAALHKAMCEPSCYLRCDCCKTKDTSEILSSFPDLCIAYKLHLECGIEVNLYDWLQSFCYKVDGDNEMESDNVDAHVHARFLQAVKDLQFLGFIAPSRKKADHVKKLRF